MQTEKNSLDSKNYNSQKNFDLPMFFKNPPTLQGFFSVDKNRKYISNASNLKCLYTGNNDKDEYIHLDLNKGYENVQHKPPNAAENEKLDHLLEFIKRNVLPHRKHMALQNESLQTNFLGYEFVCFRGLLRFLMCTAYDTRDDWIILATKYKGTIYLYKIETPQKKEEQLMRTEQVEKILSYGFKFEQYMLTDNPSNPPDTEDTVNESEEFCCMFKGIFKEYTVLYGAEMDGVDNKEKFIQMKDNQNITDLKFLELKVTLNENARQLRNYHQFKTRNWWCQCILANVDKIIVGLRNERGIVNNLETVNVSDLPALGEEFWKPTNCVIACHKFLQMVSSDMDNINCSNTVYKYTFTSKKRNGLRIDKYIDKNRLTFLPDWYVKEFSVNKH